MYSQPAGQVATGTPYDGGSLMGQAFRGVRFQGRQAQDKAFAIIYILALLAVFGLGIQSATNANTNFKQEFEKCEDNAKIARSLVVAGETVNTQYEETFAPRLRGSKSLPPPQKGWQIRSLHEENSEAVEKFLDKSKWVVIGCFVLSFFFGFGWVVLLEHYSRPIVYGTVALIPISFIVPGLALMGSEDTRNAGLVFIAVGAVIALILFCIRRKLELTAAIISESATALRDNKSLLPMNALLVIAYMILALVFFLFIAFAALNGKAVPNSNYVYNGEDVYKCHWEIAQGKDKVIALTSFVLLWTAFLFNLIRLYFIAGTVGVWYFHSTDRTGVPTDINTSTQALKWAMTTSFGSLTFGSLVLTIIEIIRSMAEKNARENRSAAAVILACIVSCIQSIIEFISRFAIIWSSITGDSFCESAKQASEVLKRNLLSSLVVDRTSSFVLNMGALVLAVILGFIGKLLSSTYAKPEDNIDQLTWVVFFVVFFLSFLILVFFAGILLSIVDSVFLFFAIDKDNNVGSSSQTQGFHSIYSQMQVQPQPTA